MTPRDYLSSKNRTPLRKTAKTPGSIQKKTESQIPRFVKFAQKGKVGKIPDFAKMHEKNFKKMDSLDTYVEKKKKLTDTITKQLEKAKALSMEHNSLVKQLKSKTPRNTDTTESKQTVFQVWLIRQNCRIFQVYSQTYCCSPKSR